MSFEKVIGGNSSIVDILSGCSRCDCGCGKCNSKDNPSASNDNGGSDTANSNFGASQAS